MSFSPSAFHGGLFRREMVPFIPGQTKSILDVGCSHGLFGAVLREANPLWRLVGIEPDPEAARDAANHYDQVIDGFFPADLPSGAVFDCIVFNDVLEHVVDPWSAVRAAREHLTPNGRIVASIPNVRYAIVVRDLLLNGKWEYTDWGILDRTHLRFFTRESIEALFADSGFSIQSLTPINAMAGRKASILVGRFRDMRFQQFAVVAAADPR